MNEPCDRPCCVSMRRLLGEALTERDEAREHAAALKAALAAYPERLN